VELGAMVALSASAVMLVSLRPPTVVMVVMVVWWWGGGVVGWWWWCGGVTCQLPIIDVYFHLFRLFLDLTPTHTQIDDDDDGKETRHCKRC
jgi:hypothetical protein